MVKNGNEESMGLKFTVSIFHRKRGEANELYLTTCSCHQDEESLGQRLSQDLSCWVTTPAFAGFWWQGAREGHSLRAPNKPRGSGGRGCFSHWSCRAQRPVLHKMTCQSPQAALPSTCTAGHFLNSVCSSTGPWGPVVSLFLCSQYMTFNTEQQQQRAF